MTEEIRFKRGSTLPIHQVTLYRPGEPDTPLVLTGAEVRLIAEHRLTGEILIDTPLEILDPTIGLCQLSRGADEYPTPGDCRAEIVVTFGDGEVLILPKTGYYRLAIEDSLI